MQPAKILYIVDREGALATLLAGLLSSHDLRVETRADGEELLANLDVDRAACVFVEMHAPGMSAAEIQTQLGQRGIAIPVLRIDGRMAADAPPRPGRGRGSAGLAGPDAFPALEVLSERFARLTSRQREVARLVAQGYSSKELARALNLSKNTVDNHRTRILEKLQLGNFVQVGRFLALLAAEEQRPSASGSGRSSRRM